MKIALYNPFILQLGGGEKFTLSMVEYLLKKHQVSIVYDVTLDPDSFKKEIKDKLNINVEKAHFEKLTKNKLDFLLSKFRFHPQFFRKFDLVIYVHNEIPNIPLNKTSIGYVQFPFDGPLIFPRTKHDILRIFQYLMLWRYSKLIANAKYPAFWTEKFYGKKTLAIYPRIDVDIFKAAKIKKNQIVSVGRFFEGGHNKKQLEMVKMYKQLVDKEKINWKYILIGGVTGNGNDYFNKVVKEAKGYNIDFIPNASYEQLKKIYAESKIFWHATGFQEDENKDPGKFEHFGITTVEAMSAGLVPVVINNGGQPEIVTNKENGFLWNNQEELINYTLSIIKTPKLFDKMSEKAIKRSHDFDTDAFNRAFQQLMDHYEK